MSSLARTIGCKMLRLLVFGQLYVAAYLFLSFVVQGLTPELVCLAALGLSYPFAAVANYWFPGSGGGIAYAFSLCGGGHEQRARIFIPLLRQHAPVTTFASGRNPTATGRAIEVNHESVGFTWIYKDSSVSWTRSVLRLDNLLFFVDVPQTMWLFYLRRYSILFVDLDAVATWAARLNNILSVVFPFLGFERIRTVCFGHHACFKNLQIPAPPGVGILGRLIIRLAFTAVSPIGRYCAFHFGSFGDHNTFVGPIAESVRKHRNCKQQGHITVYFPGADEEDIRWLARELSEITDRCFRIFSPCFGRRLQLYPNVVIRPKNPDEFARSLASGAGLLCSAGFMAPLESRYRGVAVCVIPQTNQFEQLWNAAGLAAVGGWVIWQPFRQASAHIRDWVRQLKEHRAAEPLACEDDAQRLKQILRVYLREAGLC